MSEEDGFYSRAEAAVQEANKRAEKTRKDFENWMHTSIWGVMFDVLNCVLSLLSVTMYVIQTYYSEEIGPLTDSESQLMAKLDQVELWLTFFFLLDYAVYLYAADQRIKHAMKPLHVIDFITILPGTCCWEIGTGPHIGAKFSISFVESLVQ